MRVSTKGQVTIPIDIRDKLGLFPHTEIIMQARGNKLVLEKKANHHSTNKETRGDIIISRMSGKGSVAMTTDEIMKLTRS